MRIIDRHNRQCADIQSLAWGGDSTHSGRPVVVVIVIVAVILNSWQMIATLAVTAPFIFVW